MTGLADKNERIKEINSKIKQTNLEIRTLKLKNEKASTEAKTQYINNLNAEKDYLNRGGRYDKTIGEKIENHYKASTEAEQIIVLAEQKIRYDQIFETGKKQTILIKKDEEAEVSRLLAQAKNLQKSIETATLPPAPKSQLQPPPRPKVMSPISSKQHLQSRYLNDTTKSLIKKQQKAVDQIQTAANGPITPELRAAVDNVAAISKSLLKLEDNAHRKVDEKFKMRSQKLGQLETAILAESRQPRVANSKSWKRYLPSPSWWPFGSNKLSTSGSGGIAR